MTTLVTGGAGFLGSQLIRYLLAQPGGNATERIVAADRLASPVNDPRVTSQVGDITDRAFIASIVTPDVTRIWHLAAVLSGQAEAEYALGIAVNVGATEALLEACRTLPAPPRFVFSSTVAVYGGTLPAVVPEDFALRPQSWYGTAKAIAELLVLDHTRRGIVDGVVCRVPTVAIRPGAPNSALSSFVSGIVREPIAGIESLCPVPLDTRLWVSSPAITGANLAHAGQIDPMALGDVRSVNLPGLTVTPGELLDSLERLAGAEVRARVRVEHDPHVSRIVASWPGAFDDTRATRLGFVRDTDVDAVVDQFLRERTSA